MAKGIFQDNSTKMDVYISTESVITGDLKTKSNIKVDGRVNGNVNATGNVHIGPNALVEGAVNGMDVQIAGIVNGNVTAAGGLTLFASAKLNGDVNAASIQAEKGVVYKGNMTIGAEPVKESAKVVKDPSLTKPDLKK